MDVHASPAELPELQEFLASFELRFRRPEGRAALPKVCSPGHSRGPTLPNRVVYVQATLDRALSN